MAYIDIWSMLGFNNNATMFMEAFRGVSNIILTENPQFTEDDFSIGNTFLKLSSIY